jgi:hypothetical protein
MCVSQNASHVRPLLFADGEVQQLIPFPGQLPTHAHFIDVANGCSRCVAFLFVLSVSEQIILVRGVYCVYAFISQCVCASDQNRSRSLPNTIFYMYICVCHFSLPRVRLIHASAPASIWAPACWNLSISCLDSRAPKQEIRVPTSEFESICILFVCWCGYLLASFPLSRAACGLTKTETDLYMILQISCYVYEQILRDGVSKNEKNWCAPAFFWKYRCLYCCSLHIIYDVQ